jgi:hypothetical protein
MIEKFPARSANDGFYQSAAQTMANELPGGKSTARVRPEPWGGYLLNGRE